MKKGIIITILGVILVAAILGFFMFSTNQNNPVPNSNNSPNENSPSSNNFNPDFARAGPPTIIYKTKSDYYNLVPVILSEDKTKITGYPDVRDVYYKGQLAYPTRLDDGYLLDNRGLSKTSAFLNITYEEYSKLSQTPTSVELFDMIIDKNPFTEIYDCGNRYQFNEDNETNEINLIVNSGQLSKCKSLI